MIRVLSDETINQIAAGEVIENPSSCIKELIDNSLDAGATFISIEIKGGGFQLIRVSDNGCGMGKDDAALCFERHATSKISTIDDLATLSSMGFRGEALASIAAIGKVTLTTAVEEAIQLEIEGGKLGSIAPAARRQGTTFEIRSLFYNTPARKKFQKHPSASTADVHKLVVTMAMAYPEVGFELVANEEKVVDVQPEGGDQFVNKLRHRIDHLYEHKFLNQKIEVKYAKDGYELSGFISTVSEHKPNRTGQYLFVNRRPIFSSQISFAVKEGYGQRLDSDRFPLFVLHLTVPTDLIDVNVHPQKREVRFQQTEFIRQFIKEALREAFGMPLPQVSLERVETRDFEKWESTLLLREEPSAPSELIEMEQVIGLFMHYLLLDGSTVEGYRSGIVWVDLKRVSQWLIEEQLKHEDHSLSQGLLIPLPLELSGVEAEQFSLHQNDLKRYGFVLECSGKQSYLIQAIPPFLDEADAQDAIRMVLQSDEEFEQTSKKVASFATRRKTRFMLQEALALWKSIKQRKISEGIAFTGQDEIDHFFK